MRAAAEAVEPGLRAGVGVLETPAAGQTEFRGAVLNELDQTLGIAGDVVAHPELGAAMSGLERQEETRGGRFLRRANLGQEDVEVERARGVYGRAEEERLEERCEGKEYDSTGSCRWSP